MRTRHICCYTRLLLLFVGTTSFLLFLVGGSIACGMKVVCDHIGGMNAQALPQVGGHCLETSTRAGMGTGT